jgi:hypothetical protein
VSLTELNATADQSRAAILVFVGTLTGNVNIVVPAQSKTYATLRQTTGSYDIVIKNSTGSGTTLPSSGAEIVICTTATCVGLASSIDARINALGIRVIE